MFRVVVSYLETFESIFLRAFAIGNDVFMVAVPWIVSPSFTIKPPIAQLMPSPWFLTAVYSILEPLATRILYYIGADPGHTYIYTAFWHCTSVLLVIEAVLNAIGAVLEAPPDENRDKISVLENGVSEEPKSSSLEPKDLAPVTIWQRAMMHCRYLLPLTTSAFMSASVLLWAAGANLGEPGNIVDQIMSLMAGTFLVLTMHWILDWTLSAQLTARARWLGEKLGSHTALKTQIGCMLLSLGIRFTMRTLLSLDPLLAFRTQDQKLCQEMREPRILELWNMLRNQEPFSVLEKLIRTAPFLSLTLFKFWAVERNDRRRMILKRQDVNDDKSESEQSHVNETVHLPTKMQRLSKYLEDPWAMFAVSMVLPDKFSFPILFTWFIFWIKGRRQRKKAKQRAATQPKDERTEKQPEIKTANKN